MRKLTLTKLYKRRTIADSRVGPRQLLRIERKRVGGYRSYSL